MRKLLAGGCDGDNIFELVDPTAFVEIDFEAEVVKALTCLFPDYWCSVFAGSFLLEGERRSADLALVHKNLTHWFVVEVELAGHSLTHHVLPQARCFRYGEPEQSCVTSLLRAVNFLSHDQAARLLMCIPRYVAVVSNMPNAEWTAALRGLDVAHLTISVYRSRNSRSAHEVEGELSARRESLGFARFSAIDKCLRINKGCGIPTGRMEFIDQFGNLAIWTVREESGVLWMSKDEGPALLEHHSYVQIIRTHDGRISLRPSPIQ